tara:strand:+ start:30933 stop:31679 length:747 start_codon:yes stop_codon:yes gene_type:complete
MKLSDILYNISTKEIDNIFENKLYLSENKKDIDINNTNKVSFNKFKNVYHKKIVEFLNKNITKLEAAKNNIHTLESKPLGYLNDVPNIVKLYPKIIPGISLKIEPFNTEKMTKGIAAIDLNRFKKSQLFHFLIKDSKDVVIGAESISEKDSVYIITIPPVFTEISEVNANIHNKTFKNLNYSISENGLIYYTEYTEGNVIFTMCDEDKGHVSLLAAAASGKIPFLSFNSKAKIAQISLRGVKNKNIDN